MPSIVTVLVVSKRFFFDLLPRKWLGENDSLFGLAHIFSKEIYATTNNKGKNPFFHIYEIQIELIAFVLIAMFVAVSLLRRVIIILWDAPPLLATEKPPEPAFILGSGHNEKIQTFLVTFQSSNGEGKRLLGQRGLVENTQKRSTFRDRLT